MIASTADPIDFNTNGFGIEFLILGFKKNSQNSGSTFLMVNNLASSSLMPNS